MPRTTSASPSRSTAGRRGRCWSASRGTRTPAYGATPPTGSGGSEPRERLARGPSRGRLPLGGGPQRPLHRRLLLRALRRRGPGPAGGARPRPRVHGARGARLRGDGAGGALLHGTSGVIGVEADALVLGHKLLDSGSGELCTTFEQRVRHVELAGRAAVPFTAAQRRAAEARQ